MPHHYVDASHTSKSNDLLQFYSISLPPPLMGRVCGITRMARINDSMCHAGNAKALDI